MRSEKEERIRTVLCSIHLFPFRTQKLSLLAPNVLGWKRPGRIGRCRFFHKRKRKRIRRVPFTTGSAFSSFACQKTTPAFAIDIVIPIHFYLECSVTLPPPLCREFDCLSRGFLSFCGTRYLVSRLVVPQKFTLSALIRFACSAHSENAHDAF